MIPAIALSHAILGSQRQLSSLDSHITESGLPKLGIPYALRYLLPLSRLASTPSPKC